MEDEVRDRSWVESRQEHACTIAVHVCKCDWCVLCGCRFKDALCVCMYI